jgi:D-alanine-D-alanine ligase
MPSLEKRNARCDVVLLVDQETGHRARGGEFVVDRGSVESQVLRVLRLQHSRVAVVPYDPDARVTVAELRSRNPRLVFNLTEWIDGDRNRDHVIAGLLEKWGLPYTGTAAEGLRLTRDKARAKAVVAALGVATPTHYTPGLFGNTRMPFPLFVKPQHGDGSDAISGAALVRTPRALHARVKALRARSLGPVLCEEYVEGRDLFVALLGNQPQVLQPLELVVGRRGRGAPRFATQRLKHDNAYKRRWKVSYRAARLPGAVTEDIRSSSRRIFHALKLRDYARIDYRLTPDNRLVFIEVNPNPDLGRHTFGRDLCFAGVRYEDLIRRIVVAARGRYRG